MTNIAHPAVVNWFGSAFTQLHPALQKLHCQGGTLEGEVYLQFGHGLAEVVGRRLAKKMGLPARAGSHAFSVRIHHDKSGMTWQRCFDHQVHIVSRFEAVGEWPTGFWRERLRGIELGLAVDLNEGGWHWRLLHYRVGSLPLPRWLLPRLTAYKLVEEERYRFYVSFDLPWLGRLFSYSGSLAMTSAFGKR